MILNNPVVLTPPSITKEDGSTIQFPSITLSELNYVLYDDASKKIASVFIKGLPKPIILWKDIEYTNIGDYTQVQIETRISELLGDNPQSFLQSLFNK